MGYNFMECNRDQAYLFPPSLRDWLPKDDLAWFVLDAVEQMDLGEFYAAYREDGAPDAQGGRNACEGTGVGRDDRGCPGGRGVLHRRESEEP